MTAHPPPWPPGPRTNRPTDHDVVAAVKRAARKQRDRDEREAPSFVRDLIEELS